MKEFNKTRELNKLRLKNKYIKIGSIVLSTIILTVGIIYFAFAKSVTKLRSLKILYTYGTDIPNVFTMNNSVKCTTWKYIPSGGFDAKYEDVIPEKDRLCNEDKIKHICETIKNANIKDKPLEIHLIKEEI